MSNKHSTVDEDILENIDYSIDKTIYIVDDHFDTRLALNTLMQSWGCEAKCDEYGDQLEQLPAPDILLVDYHLSPDLNGIDLAARLNRGWLQAARVIVMSADTTGIARQQCKDSDLKFIKKPISPEALKRLIESSPIEALVD